MGEKTIKEMPLSSGKVLPIEQPRPAFAGLPIDDTADSWMDDDVGPIGSSDDEADENTVKKKETDKTTNEKNSHSDKLLPVEQPKPAFVGLPIDDAADSWMNDDVGTIIESDEEEEVKTEVLKNVK